MLRSFFMEIPLEIQEAPQMAAATIVATLPQLLLSLMVQKYIVRGLTMGVVK